ncbi:hypothetical protein RHMOL_Rhmol01G0326700 [Rhododendron molle]|uniref:Uncharacterized protein n=1 Tax=Rhododendron molle TaxID=49168 RepID=A0ACC0QAQ4_RHOML|nr:hypothetical protein RHMOL_Rhmol01G0326700 [Rhododendron molle]
MNVSSGVAVHPSSVGELFVNLTGLTACDLQPNFPPLRLTTKVSPQPPSSPLGPSRVSTLDRPRVSNLEQSTVKNFDQLILGASDSSLMRQIADLNVENTRLKLLLARSSQSTELGATPSWKNVVVRDKNVSGVVDKESSAAPNAGRMKLEFFPPTVENNRIVVSPPEQIEQIGQSKWEKCIVGHFLDKKLGFTAVKNIAMNIWDKFDSGTGVLSSLGHLPSALASNSEPCGLTARDPNVVGVLGQQGSGVEVVLPSGDVLGLSPKKVPSDGNCTSPKSGPNQFEILTAGTGDDTEVQGSVRRFELVGKISPDELPANLFDEHLVSNDSGCADIDSEVVIVPQQVSTSPPKLGDKLGVGKGGGKGSAAKKRRNKSRR